MVAVIPKPNDYSFLRGENFFLFLGKQSVESAPDDADPSWAFGGLKPSPRDGGAEPG